MRVAVPRELTTLPRRSGHGRVWHHVLAELRGRVELVEGRRRRVRHPDAWLADGHRAPPPEVDAPLVVQIHEASWRDPALRAMLDPAFARVLDEGVGAAVARADAVVVPSRAARAELVAAYDLDPARVVAALHGVDGSTFRPGLTPLPDLAGRRYVLFVGALHERKNVGALREAMALLAAGGEQLSLVLVGPPAGDRADGHRLVGELTAPLAGVPVRHRDGGDDAELARVMAGAAAFCLPSLHEGFGLPALEAMACGVPVVVSDRGALPEVVGDGGLVSAPDPEALAGALSNALHDDGALRSRARARAESLTWSRTADGWLEALRVATR